MVAGHYEILQWSVHAAFKSVINQDVINATECAICVKGKAVRISLGNDFTLLLFSAHVAEQQYGMPEVLPDFPNFCN